MIGKLTAVLRDERQSFTSDHRHIESSRVWVGGKLMRRDPASSGLKSHYYYYY